MKLMVSHDCGNSYQEAMEGELAVLVQRGKELDKEMLRWVIEDGDGDIVEACKIHHDILDSMRKINQQ